MNKKYRLLIVDDHTLLRAGLRALLDSDASIEVVGEAQDGRDAIRAVGQLSPDLVLMDLTMPGMNGTEAITAIKQRYPDVRILVMTLHKAEEFIHASLKAGASGYILKDSTSDELKTAIHNVLSGKTHLSADVASKVVHGFIGGGSDGGSPFETLTQREREVLKLVAEGRSNKEVAEFLSLSVKTVEKHRSNLMTKLDLHNTAQITAYAIEKGLVVK